MGIKTLGYSLYQKVLQPLKNLPTTWGLRRCSSDSFSEATSSEKPPHHMGIKTQPVSG